VFLIHGIEEELTVTGYTDASFQTDKDDSKSQLEFVFTLNGGAVSWKISKQDTWLIIQPKPSTLQLRKLQRKVFG
jgi:hypothetical protein